MRPLARGSRPQQLRLMQIIESLRSENPPTGYSGNPADWTPNAKQFAKAFGCHFRTVQRDIEHLKDCGLEIDYDRSEHRVAWTNKSGIEPLPLMSATENEMISLMTALAISSSVLDSATAGHLQTFLNKLEQHIQGGFLHSLESIQRIIRYRHTYAGPADTRLWTQLQRAILDQRGIRLTYSSPFEANEPRDLKLLPVMLANLEGIWYLYALKYPLEGSTDADSIHLYRLNRMSKVRLTRSQAPEDWDREGVLKRMEKGIGAWQGGEEEKVCFRISAEKIGFIKERAWNPGHRFTRQRDGFWLLRFKASQVEHLVPFVLQWGPDIEVIEPANLREEVLWTARQILTRHGNI